VRIVKNVINVISNIENVKYHITSLKHSYNTD